MTKKFLSLILSSVLLFTLGVPSFAAEESLEDRLSKVTLKVKNTLNIGADYTSFHGNLTEYNGLSFWNLNWSSETDSLTVHTSEEGKVYRYSRYVNDEDYSYENNFAPKFPSVSSNEAEKAANEFLSKVFSTIESTDLSGSYQTLTPRDTDSYYFSGVLKLNGLDSPIFVSVGVSTKDLKVSSFNRTDRNTTYLSTIPSSIPQTTKIEASKLLHGTTDLELRYILQTDSSDTVLRYVPKYTGNYVVDAKTGKLIDIDKLAPETLYGASPESVMVAADTAMGSSSKGATLTPVETQGIAKLKNVLSQEQLDTKIRAITELGVTANYRLTNLSYSLNKDTGEVIASLRFIEGDNQKYITADAKDGSLKSIYTIYPYKETESESPTKDKASAFLAKYFPDMFSKTKLYNSTDNYTYVRVANDIIFPTDALYITINKTTGFVDSFSFNWTDEVVFISPEGIISEETAINLYNSNFITKLSYVSVPVAIDPSIPEHIPYIDYVKYVYELILGYTLYFEEYIEGIDAISGDVIKNPRAYVEAPQTYDDLNSTYAKKQILELSKYGIGLPGKSFKPRAQLNQLDMIMFLLSASGQKFTEIPTDDEINNIYMNAYSRGILKKADRNPGKLITRSDLVKTIISMSGYGKAADLQGIFTVDFKDANKIPTVDYGYVAIAKGLSMIKGDTNGNFNPTKIVTRADAAIMLFNFMSR